MRPRLVLAAALAFAAFTLLPSPALATEFAGWEAVRAAHFLAGVAPAFP